MNAFALLSENEKIILLLFLKGSSTSQVADLFRRTTGVINDVRLEIMVKLEQASPFKSPETRRF